MARHTLPQDPARGTERRGEPRVVVAFPASIRDGHLHCSGRAVDASEHGVLIQLNEPLLWEVGEATITLRLPASEPWEVRATVVRAEAGDGGRARLALRMTQERLAPRPRRRSPSRREVESLAELGTRAYELALIDPAAEVPEPLGRALIALCGGVAPEPRTARELLAAIDRRADGYSPDQPR